MTIGILNDIIAKSRVTLTLVATALRTSADIRRASYTSQGLRDAKLAGTSLGYAGACATNPIPFGKGFVA